MASLPPIDPGESVAGEEDPGAAVEVPQGKSASATPRQAGTAPATPADAMSPGEQAPPGTAGTGETVCPTCGGSGRLAGGTCPECEGSGRITVGIGGA